MLNAPKVLKKFLLNFLKCIADLNQYSQDAATKEDLELRTLQHCFYETFVDKCVLDHKFTHYFVDHVLMKVYYSNVFHNFVTMTLL